MRTILLTLSLFFASVLYAQESIELPLWPQGAPNDNGLTAQDEKTE